MAVRTDIIIFDHEPRSSELELTDAEIVSESTQEFVIGDISETPQDITESEIVQACVVPECRDGVGLFHKGAQHTEVGLVDPTHPLRMPMVSKNFKLSYLSPYTPLPAWNAEIMAAEVIELYCMVLARDVPFAEYRTHPVIAACSEYLNALPSYPHMPGKVTPYNIFRGPLYADIQGLHISQFLLRKMHKCHRPRQSFLGDWNSALAAQNPDHDAANVQTFDTYINTGRDLASYCYYTHPLEAFQAAVRDLVPLYDLKYMHIQHALVVACAAAAEAAEYIQWHTLILRPEAYGIEIERVLRDKINTYGVPNAILSNPVLPAIRKIQANCVLTQAYPSGSPLQPSHPCDKAAMAGACATVMKCFYDIHQDMDVYKVSNAKLQKIAFHTTLGDEIDKLACNLSMGGMWAGIQYPVDIIAGLNIGEHVAVLCLRDIIATWSQPLSLSLRKFNGRFLTLKNT